MRSVGWVQLASACVSVLVAAACASAVTVEGRGSAPPLTSAQPTTTPPASTPPVTTPATTPTPTPPSTTTAPTTAPPATTLPARLRGQDWERIPTARHVVALTFDAGGNAAGVRSILGTLAREHIKATFFLTGAWARTYPAFAATIAATQRIGNHSMTHPKLTTLTDAQIRSELRRGEAAIRDVCGADPTPLFRFPFGDRDTRTISVVNDAGYVAVRWTVDTLGWEGTHAGTADSVVNRVLAALQPGEIVLMHLGANPDDHSTLDADALPRVIAELRARGYGFVTLDALLA